MIIADIPLASEVVAKGGQALDPRGELYADANVGERFAVRNLFDELRGAGQVTGGPSNFTSKDRQAFANQLDRWLTAANLLMAITAWLIWRPEWFKVAAMPLTLFGVQLLLNVSWS